MGKLHTTIYLISKVSGKKILLKSAGKRKSIMSNNKLIVCSPLAGLSHNHVFASSASPAWEKLHVSCCPFQWRQSGGKHYREGAPSMFFLSCRYLGRVTGTTKGYFCSSRLEHPVTLGNNEEQSSVMENNEAQQVSRHLHII